MRVSRFPLAIAALLVAATAYAQPRLEVSSSLAYVRVSGDLGPCTTFVTGGPDGHVIPVTCRSEHPEVGALFVRLDYATAPDWSLSLTLGDGTRERSLGFGTTIGGNDVDLGEERYRLTLAELGVERRLGTGRVAPFLALGAGATRVELERGAGSTSSERLTARVGTGARAELTRRLGLRLDLGVHLVEWEGGRSSSELLRVGEASLGLAWRP